MNLFELFIKIGVDDQASNKLSGLSSKLGNGLKTAAKIGTAAVGAAAAGITALTTAAVSNYAEYEQLVGGVETLFKTSSDKVMKYAESAYKTAGLSANAYMETVTSFSASLLQSLGGDTASAVEYADMAITDMSDNANKMGTSMEMIQNAYQGFAKQNYTMLDNLKLGYGGTQAEMQRLIADAAELSDTVDAQSMSFDNIVEAIHVVQTEMGITGTTAKEAGTTIQGSVASMKSAWTNLLTGLANGNANIQQLVGNLVTTIVGDGTEANLGVLGNILPAVKTALNGASTLVSEALPQIVEIIPTVINENLPVLAGAAVGIIQSLIDGISQNQEMLFDTILGVVTYLAEAFITMLPQIAQLGLNLIASLANGISGSLPELIPTIIGVVSQIVETLINNADLLINAALEIIVALAMGLIASIPQLIEAIPKIVIAIVNAFESLMSQITDIGKNIVNAIGNGIKSLVSKAVTWARDLINNFISGIKSLISQIIGVGKSVVTAVGDGIKSLASEALTWGKDMIDNFVNGIKSKINAVTSVVSNIANTIKSFLGFSEPEKGPLSNFHTFAPDMMNLFIKGIRDNEKKLTDQIEKTFDFGERTITAGISYRSYVDGGFPNSGRYGASQVSVVQNIYSEAKTAADLMQEALYQQERAVLLGV